MTDDGPLTYRCAACPWSGGSGREMQQHAAGVDHWVFRADLDTAAAA